MKSLPETPKTSLGNYLPELSEETLGDHDGIYLENAANMIEEIWGEIVETEENINVRELFPEQFGISSTTFYDYKNGEKSISIRTFERLLQLWQELCDKSGDEIRKKWNRLLKSDITYGTKSLRQEVKLPKYLTPKLAYLIGWICGDGSLNRQHNYVLKISEKSKKQLKLVLKPLLNEIFNVNSPIFKRSPGGYAIQIGSKSIFIFLTRILKIRVGRVPEFIKDENDKIKSCFLAGFFDADGYVNFSYKDYGIEIFQSRCSTLESLIELSNSLEIPFKGPHARQNNKGKWYFIFLRKKSDILKFISKVRSNHIDKSRKIRDLEEKIEKNWNN